MDIVVVIGAGLIGQAIARRVAVGNHVVLADRSEANANGAAQVMANAGYEVSIATVDMSSRQAVRALVVTATRLGKIVGLIHAAGVSPSEATPDTILHVDLDGTAVVLEEFGDIVARGGSGVVISSQSGHRLPALSVEQNKALATTPADELLALPFTPPIHEEVTARDKTAVRSHEQRDRRRRLLVRPGRRSARPINAQKGED
jgi:NAD(P)-dependent dehydrogenase (short-subunit alcohol dehydrogenase family)